MFRVRAPQICPRPSAGPIRALASACFATAVAVHAGASASPLSPSQVTAPSYRPTPVVAVPEVKAAREIGPAPPAGADQLYLRLDDVEIEGGFSDLAEAGTDAAKRLQGRRVSVADIFAAARGLEQAYARAGYILARVVVPPQRLAEGARLKLRVIDGFLEAVELDKVPEPGREVVRARVATLVGRRHLKLADIERVLLIAGAAPGLTLQSAIARGDAPEGAKLVLQATQKFVSATMTADNRLPASLGGRQSNTTLSLNDVFGFGEQVYATAGSSLPLDVADPQGGRLFVLSFGATAPIGVDGFSVSPEYTHSLTRPAPPPGAPATLGEMERVTATVGYDLVRDRSQTLKLDAALGYVSQSNVALGFGTTLDRDAYGFARAGAAWSGTTPWGAPLQAHFEVSQGLGGRDAYQAAMSGVPLSRLGASPYFHKLEIGAQWSQSLPEGLRLDLRGKGQFTFGAPVFVSEQFALDGVDAVSAVPDGTFSVDAGAAVRAELVRPFSAANALGASVWSPYLFAAGGAGRLMRPTAVETAAPRAAAFGLGIRVQMDLGSGDAMTAGVELGREISNEPAQSGAWRVMLNLGLQF